MGGKLRKGEVEGEHPGSRPPLGNEDNKGRGKAAIKEEDSQPVVKRQIHMV